jgi:hypothetical protein
VEFNSNIFESYITYKGHGSYGTATTVDLSGKVSKVLQHHKNSNVQPFYLDGEIEVHVPIEKFKYFKDTLTVNGTIEEKRVQVGILQYQKYVVL